MFTSRKQLFGLINGYVINNSLMCSYVGSFTGTLFTYVENIEMYISVLLAAIHQGLIEKIVFPIRISNRVGA